MVDRLPDWLGDSDSEGEFDAVIDCEPDALLSWLAATDGVSVLDFVTEGVDEPEGVDACECVPELVRVDDCVCDGDRVCDIDGVAVDEGVRVSVWDSEFICEPV